MTASKHMVTNYADDVRLFRRSRWFQGGIVLLLVLYYVLPSSVLSDFQLQVANYVGLFAIGAIGLNLLTGYTGQVSLGHAFFVGVGAYTAAFFGTTHGWPLVLWLPMAALLGGLIGAAIGPFALRLRGQYLAIVTLGLLFVGEHLANNWDSVTGGTSGASVLPSLELGPLDFRKLELGGAAFTPDASLFFLIWGVLGLVLLLTRNIVRSRPGRALQAVRDRDIAAEIIGVSLFRYKVSAFALSSALAAVAGGFYGVVLFSIRGDQFGGTQGLFLSIQFIAIIIVGGVGTLYGSVLGAMIVGALPRVIDSLSRDVDIPFVFGDKGGADGFLSIFSLNQMLFGVLIVLFLLFEPRGLAAVWLRIKAYFKSWPFSY